MLGTYAALLGILVAAGIWGQVVLRACGRREWSWLSPAIGMGLLGAAAWAMVRLPGEGLTAALGLVVLTLVGVVVLIPGGRPLLRALRPGLWVLVIAVVAGSVPFLLEGRFGILGTGLNPDMSQHLYAAANLVDGDSERLITTGYPLGPHAIVVAIAAIHPSLVEGFNGLTLAILVAACLAPLEILGARPPGTSVGNQQSLGTLRRSFGALLTGGCYMSVSYLVQGAFKETMLAMLVLAFAIALNEFAGGRLGGFGAAPRWRLLRAVPLAALAIGAVYSYSFPGLLWMFGAIAIWLMAEAFVAWRSPGRAMAQRLLGTGRLIRKAVTATLVPLGIAFGVLLVAIAPELGRMADFASFETFNPAGAGMGNLFDPISPLEALGVWPSGDFRLDPGEGAVPAAVYWLASAIGLAALAYGLRWWIRLRERALPSALVAATLLWAYAELAGTPYQASKAIVIASPLVMLIAARALLESAPRARTPRGLWPRGGTAVAALAATFLIGAAGSSLLVLVNGPVGPDRWSRSLTELGPDPEQPTLVLVPQDLLDQNGFDLVAWELRGGEVCIAAESLMALPPGIGRVITIDSTTPPFGFAMEEERSGGDTAWSVPPVPGTADCPFIADGPSADPGAAAASNAG